MAAAAAASGGGGGGGGGAEGVVLRLAFNPDLLNLDEIVSPQTLF